MSTLTPEEITFQATKNLRSLATEIIESYLKALAHEFVPDHMVNVTWLQNRFVLAKSFLQHRKNLYTRYQPLVRGEETDCDAARMASVRKSCNDVQWALRQLLSLWKYCKVLEGNLLDEFLMETVPYFDWISEVERGVYGTMA